jgi:hypothetical protein
MAVVADATGNCMNQRLELVETSRMERNTMVRGISNLFQRGCTRFVRFGVPILIALTLGCLSAPIFAQDAGQRTFTSAEDASRALFDAMQAQDDQAPLSILGPAGKDILSSLASSLSTRRCIASSKKRMEL